MITKIINKLNTIQVDWQLSNVCNFNCPYCPDGAKNGSSGWPSLKSCFESFDILNERGKCSVTFSGGELTLWKEFSKLCSYIKQSGDHNIHLITNGYRSHNYWKRLDIDQISFSWHPTSKMRIEKWCNNINLCNIKSKRVFILCYPNVWNKVVDDFNYLKNNLNDVDSIELKYVDERAKKQKILYTHEQLKFIQDNSVLNFAEPRKPKFIAVIDNKEKDIPISEILTKGLNKFKNWKCNAGIKNIVLQFDGNVQGTSACNVGNSLGNWHIGFFEFADAPLVCNVENCWCAPDIRIDKWI